MSVNGLEDEGDGAAEPRSAGPDRPAVEEGRARRKAAARAIAHPQADPEDGAKQVTQFRIDSKE